MTVNYWIRLSIESSRQRRRIAMNEINARKSPPPGSTSTFSLEAMFLMTALFCLMLAMLSWIFRSEAARSLLAVAVSAGATWGFFTGIMIGLYHYRRMRGVIIGMPTGTVVGAMAGPLCIQTYDSPWATIVMSFICGVILICVATLFRWLNKDDPVSKRPDFSQFRPQQD